MSDYSWATEGPVTVTLVVESALARAYLVVGPRASQTLVLVTRSDESTLRVNGHPINLDSYSPSWLDLVRQVADLHVDESGVYSARSAAR